MSEELISEHSSIWAKKPGLRAVYNNYHNKITINCHSSGHALEIGSGSGHFSPHGMPITRMDILSVPGLDLVGDATLMPFAPQSFANIVMIDVLHHLGDIPAFFNEAARILRKNGRIIMIEPGITPLSGIFYRLFHPEPVLMKASPLTDLPWRNKAAFDGNQAIPTLLCGRDRKLFEEKFPQFTIKKAEFFDIIPYPLSGGFKPWSLLPPLLTNSIIKADKIFSKLLGRLLAFRLLIVIELKA